MTITHNYINKSDFHPWMAGIWFKPGCPAKVANMRGVPDMYFSEMPTRETELRPRKWKAFRINLCKELAELSKIKPLVRRQYNAPSYIFRNIPPTNLRASRKLHPFYSRMSIIMGWIFAKWHDLCGMCAGPDTNVQKIHAVQRDLKQNILNFFHKNWRNKNTSTCF